MLMQPFIQQYDSLPIFPKNPLNRLNKAPPQLDPDFKHFLQSKINECRSTQDSQRPQSHFTSTQKQFASVETPLPNIKTSEVQHHRHSEYTKSTALKQETVTVQPFQPEQQFTNTNPFDMLWSSTYLTKYNINDYIEENKALKAKIWNYEKENRKMIKQLESWGLAEQIESSAKPFVDSATLQKVFKDSQYQTVTKKQQLVQLQEQLKIREEEVKQIEDQIEKQKADGTINADFEKDSVKEFYVILHKAQQNDQFQDQDQYEQEQAKRIVDLNEQKYQLRTKTLQMAEVNSVFQFEVEVQQNMYKKLLKETQNNDKRFQVALKYQRKFENQIKEKTPTGFSQLQSAHKLRINKKKLVQPIGRIEKTPDEILNDRNKQLEEQKKRIEQLSFQIQEMIRTCIMEKQDLQKEIAECRNQMREYNDKILYLKLNIQKFDTLEQKKSTDKSNCWHQSIFTQNSK